MIKNISEAYLNSIQSDLEKPISEKIKRQVKRCLIDYLGATFAGAHISKDKLRTLIVQLGDTSPTVSTIGMDTQTSLTTAALINGIASHTAELDDGVISGIIHPGTPVFSALLPYAQKHKIEGDNLLRGIIAGYEASVRLANAIQPSHKFRGYHATATCGMIGAVIGILTCERASITIQKRALSAAVVSAGGSLKALEDNSQLKPYNSGHAAASAITAVAMAKSGFDGPDDPLGGTAGLLNMMADEWNPSELFSKTPHGYAIEQVYFKPYAACRYCHPAIEAALVLKLSNTFNNKSISSIEIATYALSLKNHDHKKAESISSAKMSIPFSVAIALDQGAADIDNFSEQTTNDWRIAELCDKITLKEDTEFTEAFPQKTSSKITIRVNNGEVFTHQVDQPKGAPENPLSDEELELKFMSLAQYSNITKSQANALCNAVWNLPESASEFFQML